MQPARVENIQPRATVRTSNVVVPSLVTRQFPACSKMLLTRAITLPRFFQISHGHRETYIALHFLFDQLFLANQTYLQNLAGKVAEIIKEIKKTAFSFHLFLAKSNQVKGNWESKIKQK